MSFRLRVFFCSSEKNIVEHGDKIPEDVKDTVKKAIEECRAAMESDDAEEIKSKVSALQVSDLNEDGDCCEG